MCIFFKETQLGGDYCVLGAFHCVLCRKGPGSIKLLNEIVSTHIILHKKHLATVSAQETKAKGKDVCNITLRGMGRESKKTHLNYQAEH